MLYRKTCLHRFLSKRQHSAVTVHHWSHAQVTGVHIEPSSFTSLTQENSFDSDDSASDYEEAPQLPQKVIFEILIATDLVLSISWV